MLPPLIPLQDMSYLPHQETAIRWMIEREDTPYLIFEDTSNENYIYGGILADEMGLGKTISVIGLMLNNPVPSTLVVAPLAVFSQWAEIGAKAGFSVFKQTGSHWTPLTRPGPQALYLANYERIVASPALTHTTWDRLVLDEAHKARNSKSQTFEQLVTIQANARWALTGTPLVNKIADITSLYRLLGSDQITASFKETLAPLATIMLARTRSQIPDGMPQDPTISHINLDFASEEESTFYKGIQGHIGAKWDRLKDRNDRDSVMLKLLLMLRLRQLSVHPQVYIESQRAKVSGQRNEYTVPDWKYSCTKFEQVKTMLAEFPDSDGTIIFCSFRKEIELFVQELKSTTAIFTYYGNMTESEKKEQIDGAKASLAAGQRTVMLVQINSGGTGLNLQFMNRVIFMSPWWNAALMDQAVGRVVRFGQTKPTYVYHIHLKQEEDAKTMNIDRFMFKKTEEKRMLCQRILNQANSTL